MNGTEYTSLLINSVCETILSPLNYVYVEKTDVVFNELDKALDELLEALGRVKTHNKVDEKGPDITRYGKTPGGLFTIQVGFPIDESGTHRIDSTVCTLPPFKCIGTLLWGGFDQIQSVYTSIEHYASKNSLVFSEENREYNYYFESIGSRQNLIGIFRGIE